MDYGIGRPLWGPERFHEGLLTVGCRPRLRVGRPYGAMTAPENTARVREVAVLGDGSPTQRDEILMRADINV